jgi:hypothetical protein
MNTYEIIVNAYPELTDSDFQPPMGTIFLRDDSDGLGIYVEKWEYSKPLPKGMKVGKN